MKSLFRLAALAAASLAFAPALAQPASQTFPAKPVRVLIGFAPGGAVDLMARTVGAQLEKRLGQPFVIENRAGAGGRVAAQATANADKDGYTLYFGAVHGMHPIFIKENPLVASRDLAPVSNVAVVLLVLAATADPRIANFQQLVQFSKANPGKLNFASSSATVELVMAVVKNRTGLDFTVVNYKGDAPIIQGMLGGETLMALGVPQSYAPHIQAGKVRALAAIRRLPSMPDVPAFADLGLPGIDAASSNGFWAAGGTPSDVTQKLSQAVIAVVKQPEITEQLRKLSGGDAVGSSAEEQLRTYEADIRFWTEAAKIANFQPQ
jgi:tripartite-type tricarboxylate transporter receptor subunit TctC